MNMPLSFVCGTLAVVALSACTATPAITREHTTMTLAQIEEAGLVCRKDRPINSNLPRTICASAAAWAEFDERQRAESEEFLAEGRKSNNFSRFNRD